MIAGIRAPKDFWMGAAYLAIGIAGIFFGRGYTIGTPANMGPGFFPFAISCLLILFAILSILRSFRIHGEPIDIFGLKGILLVVGSVILFGLLVDKIGLALALTLVMLVSAAASEKFAFDKRALLGMVAIIALCILVFVKGLGLPLPLWGSWFGG